MMAIVGVSMVLMGILILRAAKIGFQFSPRPRWASDGMCTFVLVPGFAGLCGAGVSAVGSWLRTGQWHTASVGTAGGVAIALAMFAVLWRFMSAWQERARPIAPVIPLGPTQHSPRQPALKKAA